MTFNYDRSVEHYLHSAIKNSYGLGNEDAKQRFAALRIIHFHGILGPLPWQDGEPIQFGAVSPRATAAAASNIKIIPESNDEAKEFAAARHFIQEAQRVVFMRFGYDETNLKRLGCPMILQKKAVAATCRGLLAEERAFVQPKITPDNIQWAAIDDDCARAIRRFSAYFGP